MNAVVIRLPIVMAESSEVVSTGVLNGASSDSLDSNIKVSWSAGSGCSSTSSSGIVANSSWSWVWQSEELL